MGLLCIVVLTALVTNCASVIHQLNDSEYDRMPPLSALDEHGRCTRAGSPYCVARFDLVAAPGNDLMQLIQEYSADTKKHFNHTFIDRGICIRETCGRFAEKSDDMEGVVGACVNETIWQRYGLEARLAHLFFCDTGGGLAVDALDWAVAGIFCVIVVLNFSGTIYDVTCRSCEADDNISKGAACLLSFSVVRNWRWLVSQPTDENPRQERLKALYGIKAISMMITIILHTLLLYAGGFMDNPHYYEMAFENPLHFLVVNGLTVVQIFFCVSGFLLAYNLQIAKETRSITWSLLPKIVMMRWFRLTPSYALMIAFSATWLRHPSSGPLWNFYVTEACSQCRRLWWKHLVYTQNYEPGDSLNMCLLQAWHVAVDSQLFVIGLVVYLCTARRAQGLGVLLMLTVGLLAPALHVWWRNLDPIVTFSPEVFRSFRSKTFQQLHIRAENNLTCYAIGMFVGYRVYSWQKQGVVLTKYRVFSFLNMMIIPSICLVFYSGRIFYEPIEIPFMLKILYAMMLRLVLGVIVAYSIITFVFKLEDKVRSFFEWRGFVSLGRLSYMAYLLNMGLVQILAGQRTQLQHVSVYNMLVTYLGVTTLSFLVAVPFCLMVEAPGNRLLKAIFDSRTGERPEKEKIR